MKNEKERKSQPDERPNLDYLQSCLGGRRTTEVEYIGLDDFEYFQTLSRALVEKNFISMFLVEPHPEWPNNSKVSLLVRYHD